VGNLDAAGQKSEIDEARFGVQPVKDCTGMGRNNWHFCQHVIQKASAWIVAGACFAGLSPHPAYAVAQQISGTVTHISDGDTLHVGRQSIRLDGVDAPELDERGGIAARQWLDRLVRGQSVSCAPTGKSWDRITAICTLPDGRDIGREAIRAGHARDCPRYSRGRYRADETEAGRGLVQHSYCRRRGG
jgi:micrococcal nuclease